LIHFYKSFQRIHFEEKPVNLPSIYYERPSYGSGAVPAGNACSSALL